MSRIKLISFLSQNCIWKFQIQKCNTFSEKSNTNKGEYTPVQQLQKKEKHSLTLKKSTNDTPKFATSGYSDRFAQSKPTREIETNIFNWTNMTPKQHQLEFGKIILPHYGFMSSLDKFDSECFGVFSKMNCGTKPAIWKHLQVAHKSIVDAANEFVQSEAVAAVLIETGDSALRNNILEINTCVDEMKNDQIYIPVYTTQEEIYRPVPVYAEALVNLKEMGYIKTYGARTLARDLEQLEAIWNVYCQTKTSLKPNRIGLVSNNMGHTMAAFGLCRISKIILSAHRGAILLTLNSSFPNKTATHLFDGLMERVPSSLPEESNLGISLGWKDYAWLPILQSMAQQVDSSIYLCSQSNLKSKIISLVRHSRQEPWGERFYFIYNPDGHSAIHFQSPTDFLQEIVKNKLVMNNYLNVKHGFCRHLPIVASASQSLSSLAEHAHMGDWSGLRWTDSLTPRNSIATGRCNVNYPASNDQDILLATGQLQTTVENSSFQAIYSFTHKIDQILTCGAKFAQLMCTNLITLGIAFSTLLVVGMTLPYKFVVYIIARLYHPSLARFIHGNCGTFAVDRIHTQPKCTLVYFLVLDGIIPIHKFQEIFQTRIIDKKVGSRLVYERFQQYCTSFMGYNFWKWDSSFKLKRHIKPCNELYYKQDLPTLMGKVLSQPFKTNQSPWEISLLYNYKEKYDESEFKKMVVMFKIHHSMADGYSLLNVLQRDLPQRVTPLNIPKPNPVSYSIWQKLYRLQFVLPDICNILMESYDSKNTWIFPASSHSGNNSINNNNKSNTYYISFTGSIDVSQVRAIKEIHKVSYLAVLLSCVCEGICRAMKDEGQTVPKNIGFLLPRAKPNHPGGLINHMDLALTVIPTKLMPLKSRLETIELQLQKEKQSLIPDALNGFLYALSLLPTTLFARIINKSSYHGFGISNFPVPEDVTRIEGCSVTDFYVGTGSGFSDQTAMILMLGDGGKQSIVVSVNGSSYSSQKSFEKLGQYIKNELSTCASSLLNEDRR